MNTRRVAVIGSGGWGTAIAIVLAKKGCQVTLWSRKQEFASKLDKYRENTAYLPGVMLPANIAITADLAVALADADLVAIATPSKAVRETAKAVARYLKTETILVSLSKGLEKETFLPSSQVLAEVTGRPELVAVLSGPNHAEEVARDIPSATVVAATNDSTAQTVQDVFMTPKFRVYTNPDIVGVELAGALKNIIALAAGICDGLGFGDNTKAALMTRGLTEIARLGVQMGADSLTFAGLAGIGDLIATCTSKHSRNWKTGYALGQGESMIAIMERTGMVVEGVRITEIAAQLSEKMSVSMPITCALRDVLQNKQTPLDAVGGLMLRGKTNETEDIVAIKGKLMKI
ncbi:MAG: NAD(P)H-dependent glycerol-3-phosphate dehydrogenase [Firmicutes bacterium]|nr:NAD(P)H-dependent glycerol-3-phosphate dehydrogenase [Bacillota bacterium]